jgi:hypothetical protein
LHPVGTSNRKCRADRPLENGHRLLVACALGNLFIARRHLLRCDVAQSCHRVIKRVFGFAKVRYRALKTLPRSATTGCRRHRRHANNAMFDI